MGAFTRVLSYGQALSDCGQITQNALECQVPGLFALVVCVNICVFCVFGLSYLSPGGRLPNQITIRPQCVLGAFSLLPCGQAGDCNLITQNALECQV